MKTDKHKIFPLKVIVKLSIWNEEMNKIISHSVWIWSIFQLRVGNLWSGLVVFCWREKKEKKFLETNEQGDNITTDKCNLFHKHHSFQWFFCITEREIWKKVVFHEHYWEAMFLEIEVLFLNPQN